MRAWRLWWIAVGSALCLGSAGCSASEATVLDDPDARVPGVEHGGGEGASAEVGAPREVRLRFRAQVGDAAFACGERYPTSGGAPWLTPVDLRFFVRDVRLIAASGAEVPVSLEARAPWQLEDVALIDFEDASGACASGTPDVNVELTGLAPAADYVGLSFANGVPEAVNHADPATQPPPLQAGSMHWGWLLGYRFLMAEVAGAADDGALLGSALFHLGSTACSGAPASGGITCDRQNENRVRLDGFDPDADEVVVDVLPLFEGIDLRTITTCHSGGGEECTPFFERVGVGADGSPSGEQVLYRSEPWRGDP
jgi:uncharacterized repeat protein (TIGR04052 family)